MHYMDYLTPQISFLEHLPIQNFFKISIKEILNNFFNLSFLFPDNISLSQIFVISWLNCCFYLERFLSIYITKLFFRENFCFLVSIHDCWSVFSYIKFLSFTSNFHYSEQFKLHIQTIYNVEIIFFVFFLKILENVFFKQKSFLNQLFWGLESDYYNSYNKSKSSWVMFTKNISRISLYAYGLLIYRLNQQHNTLFSSNVNEVIRAILNFYYSFFLKVFTCTKSTKSTKSIKSPKHI